MSLSQGKLLVSELQKPDEKVKEFIKFLKDPKNSNDHIKGANEWFTCSGVFGPANDLQMAQKRNTFITNLKISWLQEILNLPHQQLLVRVIYVDWIDTFALVAKFGLIRLWETSQNRCVPASSIKKIEIYHKDQLLDSQTYKIEFDASIKQYHFDGSGRGFERICSVTDNTGIINLPKHYEIIDSDFYGKKLIKYETVRYDL
jgi:hypothetical protein